MKKILLLLLIFAIAGYGAKLGAQCTLSNISVNLNSATPVGGNCLVDMDITFDQTGNAGNKFIYINLWKSSDYSFVTFNYNAGGAKGPKLSEIDGADHTHPPVAVIGIDNSNATPAYLLTYSSDPTHIIPTVGTSITNTPVGGVSHFVLMHVTFNVPGGCAGLILQGDVWSSQANSSNQAIHCASQGISFFGDPTINGQITCNSPRKAQILLSSVSTAPLTVHYTVYLDKGTIGVLDGDPVAIATTADFTLSSGTPYNSGLLNYIGNNVPGDADRPLLIELVVVAPFGKTIYGDLVNSCIPLPVNFNSFTATRNHSNVLVKWETASEQNCSGFSVQRNTDGANWQEIAFVPSQAPGGVSDAALAYSYNDVNATKGISQYRIKEVDLNNKSIYTEIRSVRGDGQLGNTIVYPNPTSDGKINVVFDNSTSMRDVSLMDMSGRTLKEWKGVTNNNLQIENLNPGMYTLRIVVPETGDQVVEKIIVNKR